jgi:subtilisin family serine protease
MHPSGFVLRRLRAIAMPAAFVRLTAIALPVTFFLIATGSSLAAPRSVSPVLRQPIDPTEAIRRRFLTHDRAGNDLVQLIIEGDVPPGLLRAKGIEVNTVAGRFMTARCPLGLLTALLNVPGIDRVQVSSLCHHDLDSSTVDIGLPSVRTVTPPNITGQTGAGILVGDVDTGIDLTSSDFKNSNGTTRLVSLWDQTNTNGPPPSGFTYGTEWTTAQINASLSNEVDTDEGHGSHVMGIAGGNGSATGNGQPAYRYVGVAPLADLCMVKTDFSASGIIDGVNYIFQRATALGKQAVVNLSLSTQEGPHDGTFGFDLLINALTGPGKIVVASAGNKGLDDSHAQLTLSNQPQSITMTVPTYTKNNGSGNDYITFTGWYKGADRMSLTIKTPGNFTIGPIAVADSSIDNSTADGYVNAYNATTQPSNGDHEIYVEILDQFSNKPPGVGTWTFTFTPISIVSTGRVDLWISGSALGADPTTLPRFVAGQIDGGVIGSPASADSVIGVGAYTTKPCWLSIDTNTYCWTPQPTNKDIAAFSSQGPLRDGRIKPDLAAPGQGVASCKSAQTSPAPQTALVVPDGVHVMLSGTSMAAPHVTGVTALLLAQPFWANSGPSRVKARLKSTARVDGFTGVVPNVAWGSGKLDAPGALAAPLSVQVLHPHRGQIIPPGKADSIQVVVGGVYTADSVAVFLSTNGGATYPTELGRITSLSPGAPRSLTWYVDLSQKTMQAKVRATVYATAAGALSPSTSFSDSLFQIETPTGVETIATAAPRFELLANQPNPFNPETTIGFGTDRSGNATLRVYSARGVLVRTLFTGWLPSGLHSARWDGRNDHGTLLASGVYLYEFTAEGKRLSRKMSLLK